MDVYFKPFNLDLDKTNIDMVCWQAYMVSVLPVCLLASWHSSLQLCQLEEKIRLSPSKTGLQLWQNETSSPLFPAFSNTQYL